MNSELDNTELLRRLDNLIRLGTIAVLDHGNRRLKVTSGELLTGWLDWPAEIGANYKRWRPLRSGTQVVLACPGGDPTQAKIIGMLYSNNITSPSSNDAIDLIEFDDGSLLEHNAATQKLTLHSAGDLVLSADSTVRIIGPVVQTGGDMTSDDVSVQHHPHDGVQPGAGQSGGPVPS
ncbi:phage baseplate assembly protein V [Motiliproteus sp.]|uniref:phage baseplate assembly protein V n=1 Tax=Motiliproteus sp. TaxID=1898955 RepID=UPI003BA852B9